MITSIEYVGCVSTIWSTVKNLDKHEVGAEGKSHSEGNLGFGRCKSSMQRVTNGVVDVQCDCPPGWGSGPSNQRRQ